MAIRLNLGYNNIVTYLGVTSANAPKYISLYSDGLNIGRMALDNMIAAVQSANSTIGQDKYVLIQFETVSLGAVYSVYGIAQNIIDFPLVNDQTSTPPPF